MQEQLTLTLFQQEILWHRPEENRQLAEEWLTRVPKSDIVVLPETFTTGFGDGMELLAEPPMGITLQWAQKMARKLDALVVGTWIVSDGQGRCFNRLHWVYPDGSYGHYDKAHTFRPSGEHEVIACGREKSVIEYKGWRIRPAVCYDLRFPTWLRNTRMAYDLLLVCANWPASRREAWRTLLRARAIENLCYVVGCNRVGEDGAGGIYSGDSCFIDYKGMPMAEAAPEMTLIQHTLSKSKLDNFRQRWPLYLDFDIIEN